MLPLLNTTNYHPMIIKVLRLIGIIVALFTIGLMYVVIIGVSFDVSGQRNIITTKLTANLGREVRLDGPIQFEISAHPKVNLGGLHISNAVGFTSGEFASLGEARLALDLWPLLRLRFQVDELSGKDVAIHLQINKSGNNNWTFNPHYKNESLPTATPSHGDDLELANMLSHLDIERISLEKLKVDFIGANAKSHFFELQTLEAQFHSGQPLKMILKGKIEKSYPYKIELNGGTLADLVRREKPWPFDFALGFLSSHLSLKGNVSPNGSELNFNLDTKDLNEFERLLQTKLPAIGDTRISGDIKYSPGKISLDNLRGTMGKTVLNGALNIDYKNDLPKIQGELTLPVMDLRPFIRDKPVAEEEVPPQNLAQIYQEIAKAKFNLHALNSADVDVKLSVGKWLSLPGEVHDAMLQVKLKHGHLTLPMQVTMGGVTLTGSSGIDASVSPARFNLALGTHDSNLGNLAGLLLNMPDIQGKLHQFDLHISSRGDNGSELMRNLDVRLNVKQGELSYGNGESSRPVSFTLDDLMLSLPAGKALQGETRGLLLEKPFSATLHGSSLTTTMQEAHAPIDFELHAGSARALIHATLQPPTESSGSEVTFELNAPHSGEVANWLGLKTGADAAINFHGNFHTEKDSWHLSDFALKLGHSELATDVLSTLKNGKPLIRFKLTSELVDVDEIESLLPETKKKFPAAKSVAANMIDIPILPQGISLADADIIVLIKRISSKSTLVVRDINFDGHIREGMMSASPFNANIAENNFSGSIFLDLKTQQPHLALQLSADELDIGRILNKMEIAQKIDAGVDHINLQLDLHSSRLGQILAQSEMGINFQGGHLTLNDANTGSKMRIALNSGELKSEAGIPVQLNLIGSLDNVPVIIGIQTAKASDLIDPKLPIPFQFNADTSGAKINLSGNIERPFTNKELDLSLDMNGSRLDNLNSLTHTSLPPWGPWVASGKLHITQNGYDVSSLLLQIGSSKLTGQGKFDTKSIPPRIDVVLEAPTIQLDDFRLGTWSPEKDRTDSAKKSNSDEGVSQETKVASNKIQQMLSREALSRQNAFVSVRVDQVVSGEDKLGDGKLTAQLVNGRADIGPIIINTPGGSAMLQMGYTPGEKDVAVNFNTKVKRFDYGILARRVDKKSEMSGTFSLDVDVNARAPYLSEILRYGKGHIDFAIWPENMKSGLLDMWAVNVLMAILPAVDSSNQSKVNCAIGRFVLNDGKLSDKTILIDTSRMRVTGKGSADFAEENIQFNVQPHAKTPQFMSFAIPIELGGKFNDFHVGVSPADILQTVGQLATSVIWVPLEMIFGKSIPPDGHDVCDAVEIK